MGRQFSRRQFIKTSAIGIAATGAVIAAGKIIPGYSDAKLPSPYPVLPENKPVIPSPSEKPLFFNAHQYNLVAAMAALIVPADDQPGATEAEAAAYVDRMVAGSEKKQKQYNQGLEWIDHTSKRLYNKDFLGLPIKEQIELLTAIDIAESKLYGPVSGIFERINRKMDAFWIKFFGVGYSSKFFSMIRSDVFYGYYSNPVSWQGIGYYGPPQPVGYLDYAGPPSSEKYISTVRPLDSKTCQNCHVDQLEKKDHKDQGNCTDCHEPHFPFQGGL